MAHVEPGITEAVDYDGEHIKTGMLVTRRLADRVNMVLRVTDLTDDLVTCGWWTFDRKTGAEIDEDLGWDTNLTGSILIAMGEEPRCN